MKKSVLINPMGTSPMVVTEMVNYIRNTDDSLRDVVMICTRNPSILAGSYAASAALRERYPGIRVHIVKLDMDDILDEDSLLAFLSVFVEVVNRERNYGVTNLYLNVSGGRKIQNIVLSLYAGILGIDEVYNVFDPDVENYNIRYEEVKSDILENFTNETEIMQTYERLKDKLEPLFYPSLGRLVFLKIDVLKLHPEELVKLKQAISGTDFTDGSLEDYRLSAYKKSGFITYDRSRTYPTDLGAIILRGLR
jgi:CRISPR-associated protein Csx14